MPASAAVAAGPGMPTRPYSMRILGGSWPSTSPESWSDTASALSKKSADLNMSASSIRRAADDLGGSNSGQMIDAMCERSYRTAQTVINHSDLYGDMAKAVKETAELIWHARGQLEAAVREGDDETGAGHVGLAVDVGGVGDHDAEADRQREEDLADRRHPHLVVQQRLPVRGEERLEAGAGAGSRCHGARYRRADAGARARCSDLRRRNADARGIRKRSVRLGSGELGGNARRRAAAGGAEP